MATIQDSLNINGASFEIQSTDPATPPLGYHNIFNLNTVWSSVDDAGVRASISEGGNITNDGASVKREAFSFGTGATRQQVTFGFEEWDTGSYSDLTDFTIPISKGGLFHLAAFFRFDNPSGNNFFESAIVIDFGGLGEADLTHTKITTPSALIKPRLSLSCLYPLNDGDVISLIFAHDSGVSVTCNYVRWSIQRICDLPSGIGTI